MDPADGHDSDVAAPAGMASSLPGEVVALIFGKLKTKKDRLAFLSVCSCWRSGCGASLSTLTLPWPISTHQQTSIQSSDLVLGSPQGVAGSSDPFRSSPGSPGGEAFKAHSEGPPRAAKRTSSSRAQAIRNSSSLSVRWLDVALKLFSNLTTLELTIPVPPDALNCVARLPTLRSLSLVLRPPPFSSAAAHVGSVKVNVYGAGAVPTASHPRDEKYEAAFTKFVNSCTALNELSISMRACRWEHWPLLSAPLLALMAKSLRSLETLHIKSPVFSSHAIGPVLTIPHLTVLTFPLDLPYVAPKEGPLKLYQRLAPLKDLHLQPYNQMYSQRGAELNPRGATGSAPGPRLSGPGSASCYELPKVLSSLTALRRLRVGGYGRSALHRAEFIANPLSSMPDLSALKQLTRLELCSLRELESIPATICSLPALETLIIQDCPVLRGLPEELGNLSGSLTHLHLHSVGVRQLPQSLVMLARLVRLSLSHLYWLEGLPQDVGLLGASLEHLTIVSCKRMSVLPPSLMALTGLSSLALSFNVFPISPSLISTFQQLSSLTLTLSSPADLALGPAIAALAGLTHLHVTMADDSAGMSISGEDITALLPVSSQLKHLKVEDLRSSCYAGSLLAARENADDEAEAEADANAAAGGGDGGQGAGGGAPHGRQGGVALAVAAQRQQAAPHAGHHVAADYSLRHFTHGPYPPLSGLRQLRVKCAWLHFRHDSFPELEVLDLVLLARSGSAAARGDMRAGPSLPSLVREVFECQQLRSFVLFTPEAPDVLSAPRERGARDAFHLALLGNDEETPEPPPSLQTFLLNDVDVMPYV